MPGYNLIDLHKIIFNYECSKFDPTIGIDENLDINAELISGDSILLHAIERSSLEVCEYIIKNGADVNNVYKNGTKISSLCNEGTTALTLAILHNQPQKIDLLLRNGVKIDPKMEKTCNYILKESILNVEDNEYLELFKMSIGIATELNLEDEENYYFCEEYKGRKLNLRVREKEIREIYKLIPSDSRLKKIDASFETLCFKSITLIANIIKSANNMKEITLIECKMHDEHLEHLLKSLGNEHTLSYINLHGNDLSEDCIDIILKWMNNNKTIVNFNLDKNFYLKDASGLEKHIKALRRNVIMLILGDRMLNKQSLFYKDYLPLDILRLIFEFADIFEENII